MEEHPTIIQTIEVHQLQTHADAAKPYSMRSSPAWLHDELPTIPEANKSLVAMLGFAGASGFLHSLAAYLAGLEPEKADIQFLRSAIGWLMPLALPV